MKQRVSCNVQRVDGAYFHQQCVASAC